MTHRMNRCWWIGFGIVAAIWLLSLNYYVQGADDATYLATSRALALGQGFVRPDLPGTPPETHFSPGYPFLLAPVWGLPISFPDNLPLLKLVSAVLGLASLFVLADAADFSFRFVSWRWVLLLSALAPLMASFATQTAMSEIPYLFASAAALWLTARIGKPKARLNDHAEQGEASSQFAKRDSSSRTTLLRMTSGWSVGLGIVLVAAYYLRVVGVTLAIGVLGYLVYCRRFRAALIALVTLGVLLAPWFARGVALGQAGLMQNYDADFWLKDYANPDQGTISGYSELFARVVNNLWVQATQSSVEIFFPTLTFGALGRVLGLARQTVVAIVGLACSSLIVVGVWRAIQRRGVTALELYLPFYIGLILLPPWVVSRNLVPIIPFLFGYFFVAVEEIANWLAAHVLCHCERSEAIPQSRLGDCFVVKNTPRNDGRNRYKRGVIALAMGVLLLVFLVSDRYAVLGGWWRGKTDAEQRSLESAAQWIKSNAPTTARLAYEFSAKLYLYTDRQVIAPQGKSAQMIQDDLRKNQVTFLVLQPGRRFGGAYDAQGESVLFRDVVSESSNTFELAYQSEIKPETRVYLVKER